MNGVVAPLLRISCRQRNPAGPINDLDFPNVAINYRATAVYGVQHYRVLVLRQRRPKFSWFLFFRAWVKGFGGTAGAKTKGVRP
jgi:hypothetical protein